MKYIYKDSDGIKKAMIEVDEAAGYYLYIYDDKGNCIADHLQHTLEIAKEQAEEDYKIPYKDWVHLSEEKIMSESGGPKDVLQKT